MAIAYKIRYKKLIYNVNRESAKISVLSSGRTFLHSLKAEILACFITLFSNLAQNPKQKAFKSLTHCC